MTIEHRAPKRTPRSAGTALAVAATVAGVTGASLTWAAQGISTVAPSAGSSSTTAPPASSIAKLKADIAAAKASLNQPVAATPPSSVPGAADGTSPSSPVTGGAPAGQSSNVSYSTGSTPVASAPITAPPVTAPPVTSPPVTAPPVTSPPTTVVTRASGAG